MKSKESVETLCTLLWFFMDAAWMMGWDSLALASTIPTLVLGLWVPVLEKRDPKIQLIDISMFFWIGMNGAWLYSEILESPSILIYAKISFVLGILFLGASIYKGKGLTEALRHFRKVRITSKAQ